MTESDHPAPGLRVWVDADACPRDVLDLTLRMTAKRGIGMTLVANRHMSFPPGSGAVFTLVSGDFNAADDHIVDHAAVGDLAITGDIPLASRLVEKGVAVIDTRGEELSPATIGERLAMRNLMEELRAAGIPTGGPKEFGRADRERFANALDRILTRLLRR